MSVLSGIKQQSDQELTQRTIYLTFDFNCVPGGTFSNDVLLEMLYSLTNGENNVTFFINVDEDTSESDVRDRVREFLYYRTRVDMDAFARRHPGEFLIRCLSSLCLNTTTFTFGKHTNHLKQLRNCAFDYMTRKFLSYAKETIGKDGFLQSDDVFANGTVFVFPVDDELQRLREKTELLDFPTESEKIFGEI